MIRILLSILLIGHGLIHFMGFAKAFNYGNITQLSNEISKPSGLLWLVTAFLFIIATILFLLKKDAWFVFAVIAIIISQILIFTVWEETKFGTIANVIILVVVVLNWGSYHFEKGYQKDVAENLRRTNILKTDLLTQSDLLPLPEPVQRYLKYAGVLNKPKLKTYALCLKGK